MLNRIIRYFFDNKLITVVLAIIFIIGGLITSPFPWDIPGLQRSPVPVDAIPDLGENQQIVFTAWPGKSPQDVEDQITYPLTSSLLGIPGVKTIRSTSMFGFSSIYIIFTEETEFYWSRSRILEKLNSIPSDLLPKGAIPELGPDATALGQIFWYTLEGRDKQNNLTSGWDLHELRTIQDYYVRYSLTSVPGVSEVASIGGFVKEYQVDLIPESLQEYGISPLDVAKAIKESNLDIGARTLEINQAEYFIRGLGYIKNLEDLGESVVKMNRNIPIRIKDVAHLSFGPAERRGILDKMGSEAVGGVVVARYGTNPLEVINNVKKQIEEISQGLPEKILPDGRISKLQIVPFYDRSILIKETLGTLEDALNLEILITIIVVLFMVANLRASLMITIVLPMAVLMTFIAMKLFNVSANIVALSGIAIAIGTVVDVGIVMTENMVRHLKEHKESTKEKKSALIYNASIEVAPAIITALLTTIVSFIPVFSLEFAEGKLFHPLAYTKTFVLIASAIVAIVLLPSLGHLFFSLDIKRGKIKKVFSLVLFMTGLLLFIYGEWLIGIIIIIMGLNNYKNLWPDPNDKIQNTLIIFSISWILVKSWLPLGPSATYFLNFIFVAFFLLIILGSFQVFIKNYGLILNYLLERKKKTLIFQLIIVLFGVMVWIGFEGIFNPLSIGLDTVGIDVKSSRPWQKLSSTFPGIGKEFMPALDEGSFLLMPTSMPHSGIAENKRILSQLDRAVAAIPEVKSVVGKLGRVESPLDPAPISMFENVINYKSEYRTDEYGRPARYKIENGQYARDSQGNLIPDAEGEYFRQWRDQIRSPDDIWQEILKATRISGVTSAPKLQPIETRLVMLQTGMRAPLGVKVLGNDLHLIAEFSETLESVLKQVPEVKKTSVFADRIVGKPYINIRPNRTELARYGLTIRKFHENLMVTIGGIPLTRTVEGREGYNIRVRYPRELRSSPEKLKKILIGIPSGKSVPLGQIAEIEYEQGPQAIKSEDSFFVGYVIFDKESGFSEIETAEAAQAYLEKQINNGLLAVPSGIRYKFTGNYENQVRAEMRLALIIPLVFFIILILLYFLFRRISTVLMIFSAIAVAFAGGFILVWLYGQPWFLNIASLREIFQVQPVYLSVAVWVGFIALFGIATDDGVLMVTHLDKMFTEKKPASRAEIRRTVVSAGKRRVRPCLMTTATTLIALLPILTATGRGSDVMIPMAIPIFGGMVIEILTLFAVPLLYSLREERALRLQEVKK